MRRQGHTASTVGLQHIVVFGGCDDRNRPFNDIHILDCAYQPAAASPLAAEAVAGEAEGPAGVGVYPGARSYEDDRRREFHSSERGRIQYPEGDEALDVFVRGGVGGEEREGGERERSLAKKKCAPRIQIGLDGVYYENTSPTTKQRQWQSLSPGKFERGVERGCARGGNRGGSKEDALGMHQSLRSTLFSPETAVKNRRRSKSAAGASEEEAHRQAYTYLGIGASGAPPTHVGGGGSGTRGKGALGVDVGPKQGAWERDGARSRLSSAGKESVARVSEGGEGKGKEGGVGVRRASLVVRGVWRPHAAVGTLEGQAFEVYVCVVPSSASCIL